MKGKVDYRQAVEKLVKNRIISGMPEADAYKDICHEIGQMYVAARQLANEHSPEGRSNAIESLGMHIELDPNHFSQGSLRFFSASYMTPTTKAYLEREGLIRRAGRKAELMARGITVPKDVHGGQVFYETDATLLKKTA